MSSFCGYCKFWLDYCIDVDNGRIMLSVRKVGVGLLAILTVTANHTKRNLQKVPGLTCKR